MQPNDRPNDGPNDRLQEHQRTRLILLIMAILTMGRVGWELLLGPRATLRDVTTQVFQNWDAAALAEIASENFFLRPDRTMANGHQITIAATDLKDLFALYGQQLGKLKRYQVIEEKVDRNSPLNTRGNVYATYKLEAEFEKAPAVIRLYLDLYGNWKLYHFIVQSPVLSPCLSQVDWPLCSARQAQRHTPAAVQTMLAKIQTLKQCVDCDLSYLNFQGMDLTAVNLTRANLSGTNFEAANLKNANLRLANITHARFKSANLHGASLRDVTGPGAIFDKANLKNADLTQAELPRANFRQANLQTAAFDRANLEEANFYQADLQQAQLNQTSLFRANFRQAKMTRTQLNGANLQCASLGGAQALLVQISGAMMDGTILPNQAVNLPETLARRKDVVLRC
jgi:uncharacterized protein YjbI with pentapeptide repeats